MGESKAGPAVVHKNGVRLKQFEQVVSNLLPTIEPSYSKLPAAPPSSNNNDPEKASSTSKHHHHTPWPWNLLPPSTRLQGFRPGQLASAPRAARKEAQLSCMLRCVDSLLIRRTMHHENSTTESKEDRRPFTIVDFGGGSGHLGIPLAILYPHLRIVVVDLRKHSLDLLHEKATEVAKEWSRDDDYDCLNVTTTSAPAPPDFLERNDPRFRACPGALKNLFSFHGPVEQFEEPFDMALALHLCGEATDVALRKAALCQAAAIIVAPCCVGKLSQDRKNPDVYNATGANTPTVQYPQSQAFCQIIGAEQTKDWDVLVKAADYSDACQIRTKRNASRRAAKALLETDRRLFLEEQFGYATKLMRMEPWEITPKNDILVAWDPKSTKIDSRDLSESPPDPDCQADVIYAKEHLLLEGTPASRNGTVPEESVDWSKEEEDEITAKIEEFLKSSESSSGKVNDVLVFPTRMGGRRRKLIHFVAARLDLAHWSVGEKDGDKTVAVARRREITKSV